MRIKYNVLWIENELDWLMTAKDFVIELLEDNGFELQPTIINSEKDVYEILKTDPTLKRFDLILVDFQLDKGDRGSTIITSIRDHKIYTEIIFYSQDLPGIREFLNKNFIDGVFTAKRDGDEFREKFEKVFLSTIKKAQDISTIRGMVLSETSELDNKIYQIIILYFNLFPANKQEDLRNYILKEFVGNLEKNASKLVIQLNKLNNLDLTNHRYFDAYKKVRILGQIIEILNHDELGLKDDFTSAYISQIIEIRNELAHCIEKETDTEIVLQTKNGDKTFDDASCKEIRNNIKKHFQYLVSLESHVANKKFN